MSDRAQQAYDLRVRAAQMALDRGVEESVANGEECSVPQLIGSFTKGMRHNDDGTIADEADFHAFVSACNSGDADEIAQLKLGPAKDDCDEYIWRSDIAREVNKVRGWESMGAGLAFDLEGPDAQSVSMPPVPLLSSAELTSEMAECYLMALARDIPIASWNSDEAREQFFDFAIDFMNGLEWFAESDACGASEPETRRRRGQVSMENVFRGILPGSTTGPFLSQFLVGGSNQIGKANDEDWERGIVAYGSITIDQRVRIATEGKDYLTTKNVFLDAQDGADLRGRETYEEGKRLIKNMRDLGTWVHYDALYEAYLNACLMMLANGYPVDSGLPFLAPDAVDKQTAFATFGGPHILSLVTEVATRALKAVRFQKFNTHRRTRPEAIGGLINEKMLLRRTKASNDDCGAISGSDSGSDNGDNPSLTGVDDGIFPELNGLVDQLQPVLARVAEHNAQNNERHGECDAETSYLLPMAYAEGSPMHPAYGSGHATVAGACVTILKAFFDADHVIENVFEVDEDGDKLVRSEFDGELTVLGELNKLADNISVGRNMAGVHYFTDAWESMLLGEKIAIGILEEQKLTYREEFVWNLTKFDGETVQI